MTTTDAVKVPQPRPAGPKVKALEQTVLASPAKLVRVIGTSNLATLSGVQTVDSVALKLGDVVLLTGQTTTHQNRLWTVMQGTWIAPLIADHPEKLPAGTKVTAQEGTSNAGKTFRLTTTGTIVLGTTALSWTQDGGSSGSGDVVGPSSATDGSLARFDGTTGKLLKDGVAPDASTLEISGSTLRQKDAGTTNAKLANMATKTYKGRTSGTTGVPEDVSAANLATDLASQTAFSGTYATLAGTVSLIDAKGDRLIGSADNTLVKKSAPANGKISVADSAQSDGWKDIDLPWHLSIDPTRVPAYSTTGGTIAAWATYYQFSNLNDEVVYNVQLGPGTWTFGLWRTIFTSYGILTVTLDGTTIATLDNYSGGSLNPGQVLTTGIVITAPGVYALKLKTTSKNASSSGYNQRLWSIDFTRTA